VKSRAAEGKSEIMKAEIGTASLLAMRASVFQSFSVSVLFNGPRVSQSKDQTGGSYSN